MAKKIVYLLGDASYKEMFEKYEYEVVFNPAKDYDIICFTGGTDIDPELYNHPRNKFTAMADHPRDAFEERAFNDAVKANKIIVGICRGAQLICALSGGKLYQHIGSEHGVSHPAVTFDGRKMMVTSSHHQMMNPQNLGEDYMVLMSCENRCSHYQDFAEGATPPPVDYEVVYFPNTNALAHQPHPEWMDPNSEYTQFFFDTLQQMFQDNPFNFYKACI